VAKRRTKKRRNPQIPVKVSTTLPPDLAAAFDRLRKKLMFGSRSEMLREVVRRFVVEESGRLREEELKRKLLKTMDKRLRGGK